MSVSVAVVGLGALGLVAVKNLAEEGFNVTGFDRNEYVGGLWKYTEEEKTSVLKNTVVNVSKERGCFTDFPFSKDTSSYATADEVHKYLQEYCEHFNLHSNLRLGEEVKAITRDRGVQQWIIHKTDGEKMSFDKVVISTGINKLPSIPKIQGLDKFKGHVLHSQAFKRPSDFKEKVVMVVGFSNTAADTATELVGHAKDIYLAHRRGNLIMPRRVGGKAIDHAMTVRFSFIQDILSRNFPNMAENMFNKFAKGIQDKAFTLRPEWNFAPAPSLKQAVPIISDNLVDCLEAGTIKSVAGLNRVVGERTVELLDGTAVAVDAIIWCTGYKCEYGLVESEYDPTQNVTAAWSKAPGSNDKPLPRLYRNVFSLKEPQSLAYLGGVAFPMPAFQVYDLASMAIAQIWKGASSLPPQVVMEKEVDEHIEWVVSLAQRGSVYPGIVKAGPWMRWANDMAGTGVNEKLGYGVDGWKFWWSDQAFCKLCMDGIYSPHLSRVFDGKRKKWDDARKAIEEVNGAR